MKKTFRKFTAAATALLTAACLMAPMTMSYTAFAAGENNSVSISNTTTGHEYSAYQIFSGNASGNALGNINWGSGVNSTGNLISDIQGITIDGEKPFENCTNASDVAGALAGKEKDSDIVKEFAKVVGKYLTTAAGTSSAPADGKYTITGLDDGYYLIKETGTLSGENTTYTSYIVEVLDGTDVPIDPKVDLPTFDKLVQDVNDTTGATEDWDTSADYDIGDDVPFQLTATIPSNYDDYSAYKFIMHDTLSTGLTFNNNVTVSLKSGDTTTAIDAGNYTVTTPGADGCSFDITFANLKNTAAKAGDTIIVTYTAKLNESAVIGNNGNPNTAYLEYSNNPTGESTETGETPDEKAVVFTYKAVIDKVDSSGNALEGADFTLEKKVNDDNEAEGFKWVEVTNKSDVDADTTTFTFTGLDDGTYRLTESTTPDGYNTIEPIEFIITAEHADTGITTLTVDNNKLSATADTGTIEADIENNKGSELPSTGGIGTTIFYVGGGALVAVAGVFLIAKKRMSSK